ncbi:MAG: NUDIX domain-containing protein [Sphingomonadales bacterium]|nr:MAG: NUDIX domain-containing protein [Sphingomonadales bacterium]
MAETVGAALVRDGRVLLGLRASHKSFAGLWDIIGGHIETGETPWSALCRELDEELGISGIGGEPIGTFTIRDHHRSSILHIYSVTAWQGEPAVRNDEHSEIRWFELEEALRLPNIVTAQYRTVFESLERRGKRPEGGFV